MTPSPAEFPAARIAFLFPGQGSQHPGMGAPWLGSAGWSQVDLVSEASGQDVAGLLLEADAATLRRTDRAQLSVFALEMVILSELAATAAVFRSPTACAGHSLGEFAALVAAGVLTVSDAAAVVTVRGTAMARACRRRPGAMCAVLGERALAQSLVATAREQGGQVWVATLNGPRQLVVSGAAQDVRDLTARAEAAGLGTFELPVDGAFHTPLMADAAHALQTAFTRVPRRTGRVPVVANVDARPRTGAAPWPQLAARHLTEPVLWSSCLQTLVGELGCDLLVEIGPGSALTTLARRTAPSARTAHVATPYDLAALTALTTR